MLIRERNNACEIGYYVTDSTSGFFPDKKSPAYKFCNLIQSLEMIAQSKKSATETKHAVEQCLRYYDEAAYDMEDRINRSKLCYQLRKDKGVNENRYNERVAALYDMCGELSQKKKVDLVQSMLYTIMFNCALCASIPDQAPYSFTHKEQLKALENARLAFKKIMTNL